jgi:hypothetical protein
MVIPIPSDGSIVSDDEQQEPEYIDEPLDPFVRDNIEIDCIIGGKQYLVTDLEVHLTDGSASNYADGIVIPSGHNSKPTVGDDTITIDIDNRLTEERRDTDEITRIFTGIISNSSRIEEKDAFEFLAFWPGFNEIQNGSYKVERVPPKTAESAIQDAGTIPRKVNYTNRRQYASAIAEGIGEFVTRNSQFDFEIFINDTGEEVNGIEYASDTRLLLDGFDQPLVVDGTDEGVLERIVKATNSVWEVDRYGNFYIGPPTPDGDVPTAVTSHKLRYMTETSAGKQSPAWQSVAVVGDGVVSKDGWSSNALISENPQKFASPITTQNRGDVQQIEESLEESEQLADPTFVYTNLEINTAEEAKHVLNKIKEDIRKQEANGHITVVGHPAIWPGDAVELPDSRDQPFGLERFAVGKVIHRINNSDGFLTKIEVMGQTNATAGLYSDEVEVPPPDRYPTGYTDEKLERLERRTEEDAV